jgi:hypothetical protein
MRHSTFVLSVISVALLCACKGNINDKGFETLKVTTSDGIEYLFFNDPENGVGLADAQGDVIIEGQTDLEPENFSYDKFEFFGDGTYNGMVRKGSFSTWSFDGSLIFEGTYQCDNNNMKLEFRDSEGVERKILAQVMSFTDDTIWLNYEDETHHVSVTFVIRKG